MQFKRYFYVVSLPRCRSTWMSHFLTTDISHCFHSLMSNYDPLAAAAMDAVYKRYVGSCDENPVGFLLTPKPYGPIVTIERDIGDCANAVKNAFDVSPDFPVEDILITYKNVLNVIASRPESINVHFNDLENNATIYKIWRHIFDHPCNIERTIQFQDTIIKVKNRDLIPALNMCASNLRMTRDGYIRSLVTGSIFRGKQQGIQDT